MGADFNLIKEIALSDFKLKYNGSVLGYLWSLLNPLLLFAVLYLVFSIFIRFDVPNYNLYLLLGIIIWSFFAESTLTGMSAFLAKASLISKVNFKKEVIIYSSILTSSFTFLLNLVVFFIFFAFSSASFSFTMLLLPIFLILLILFSLGMIFLLSTSYMKFRDVSHIWQVALQLGFWLTPIVYSISFVPERFHALFLLNPMATLINSARDIVIYGTIPASGPILIASAIIVVVFAAGYILFKRNSRYFAEEL